MHAPKQQRMPSWRNHAHPQEQPHTPPEQPCMPPDPPAHTRAPQLPLPPQSNHTHPQGATTHAPLWTELLTHASENITLPQLRCGR